MAEAPMDLKGRAQDLDLVAVLRLIKMSGGSGTLRCWSGRRSGRVLFHEGWVCYAELDHIGRSFGSRLLKLGYLTGGQLAALESTEGRQDGLSLAVAVQKQELLGGEELERLLEDQIADSFFKMAEWEDAEYVFEPAHEGWGLPGVVRFDAEAVGLEGLRRLDEWGAMLGALGSMEKVPHVQPVCSTGRVSLTPREWRVLAHIDGRRDALTLVEESGLGLFETTKLLTGMLQRGLISIKDPALELLGQSMAIALKGPIDVYNVMFLTSAGSGEVSNHLRVEKMGDEEVEVRIAAGIRDRGAAGSCLIYAPDSRTPHAVVRRLALETSGFVVLVNINSRDAVMASKPDIDLMGEIADRPYAVATYASLADEMVEEGQVRDLLQLDPKVPVVNCGLRDPEKTGEVVELVISLVP